MDAHGQMVPDIFPFSLFLCARECGMLNVEQWPMSVKDRIREHRSPAPLRLGYLRGPCALQIFARIKQEIIARALPQQCAVCIHNKNMQLFVSAAMYSSHCSQMRYCTLTAFLLYKISIMGI